MNNVECHQESDESTTHTHSQNVEIKNEPKIYELNTSYKYQNEDQSDENGDKHFRITKMHRVSSSDQDYAVFIKYEPGEFEDKQSCTNNRDNESINNHQYDSKTGDIKRDCYSYDSVKNEAADIATEEDKIKSKPNILEMEEPVECEADNDNVHYDNDHGNANGKCYRTGRNIQEYGITRVALDSDVADLHTSSFVGKHASKQITMKPFKCDVCSYSTVRSADLTRHKRKHSGKKPYKCNVCSYSAVTAWYLTRHKRKHTGEKPYKCDVCSYCATESSDLVTHKRKHTGEKPYKCDMCSYSTTRFNLLKTHIRKHTGQNPYKCDVCSYITAYSGTMEIHKRKHTGEKPYKCDVCSYSAARLY